MSEKDESIDETEEVPFQVYAPSGEIVEEGTFLRIKVVDPKDALRNALIESLEAVNTAKTVAPLREATLSALSALAAAAGIELPE